ncbi:IPExxxVDY family protein [Pseudozobellia thermophila]|nr:IPExxxVDY family protein [Pseudozobellia thermophila]
MSIDFYEDSFDLIALHSSLEDYAMAYALNLYLKSNFRRRRKDLEISNDIAVSIFEWRDDINDRYWTFFPNHSVREDTSDRMDLFSNEPAYSMFTMVPEHRDVDYFIKIEHDDGASSTEKLLKTLLTVPNIVTAYRIDTDKLKSKNNLIY